MGTTQSKPNTAAWPEIIAYLTAASACINPVFSREDAIATTYSTVSLEKADDLEYADDEHDWYIKQNLWKCSKYPEPTSEDVALAQELIEELKTVMAAENLEAFKASGGRFGDHSVAGAMNAVVDRLETEGFV